MANEWDVEKLEEWGLELPVDEPMPNLDEVGSYEDTKCIKITFTSLEDAQAAEISIKELIESFEGATYSFVK